jgi:pimeloyl-ACP methyl ester carboxylesterase
MGGTALVFVHGLFSSGKTWGPLRELLDTDPDLARVTALNFDYPTPKFRVNPMKLIPDFDAIARHLKTYLENTARDFSDVVLVSHSQGGLIIQRYLAQELNAGRADRLHRIRHVVMIACPNSGSELFLAYRKAAKFWRHPQEEQLRPFNTRVREARTVVINRAINAHQESSSEHRMNVTVYAGMEDNIVPPDSALDVFPETETIAGDHFGVIKPSSQDHPTYQTLKNDILQGIPAENALRQQRRLLIVEDQVGARLVDLLGDFDCTLVRSLTDFWPLYERGLDDHFDAALVDLNLSPGYNDRDGLTVAGAISRSKLRLPVILMTLEPIRDRTLVELCRQYNLHDVALKVGDRETSDFHTIVETVRSLFENDRFDIDAQAIARIRSDLPRLRRHAHKFLTDGNREDDIPFMEQLHERLSQLSLGSDLPGLRDEVDKFQSKFGLPRLTAM